MSVGDEDASASQLLLTTAPPEDAGARTADLYDWQAAMAAADGLAMYRDALDDAGALSSDGDDRIVCEHHEDWAMVSGSDAELVSAKHREPSTGAFTTVAQLVDGGLAHLFVRWMALGGTPTLRLVTCAGLASNARALHEATRSLQTQRLQGSQLAPPDVVVSVVEEFIKTLLLRREGLPPRLHPAEGVTRANLLVTDEQYHLVTAFLSMLSIDHGRPQRSLVSHAAPSMYVKPVLERLGFPGVPVEAVWEAVLGFFRVRMRAAGQLSRGALPNVMAYRPGGSPLGATELRRSVESRLITLSDIDLVVRRAVKSPAGYLPLAAAFGNINHLSVKMAAGKCRDISIERAEHLRRDYQQFWRDRRDAQPGSVAAQPALRRLMLKAADQATATLKTDAGPYGAALWDALADGVTGIPAAQRPNGLDDELTLGGICDLANQCKIWFSARFDVRAEVTRLRAQRTAVR